MSRDFSELADVLAMDVVLAPSVNQEFAVTVPTPVVDMVMVNANGAARRGEKNLVADLSIYAEGDTKTAYIRFTNDLELRVPLGSRISDTLAGSTTNIALALRKFSNVGYCGLLGAVGGGTGRKAIALALKAAGIAFFPLHRQGGTAVTLFLREPNGTATIFSTKPPYEVSADTLAQIRATARPRMIICSGFVPYELDLIDALIGTNATAAPTVRVLSPHVACLALRENRERCLALAARADILQLNHYEWGQLLELGQEWEVPDEDEKIVELLRRGAARIVCVTLGDQGSITFERDTGRLIRQPAFSVSEVKNAVGAGDVHLAALVYYLYARGRPLTLRPALEMAAKICAAKLSYEGAVPTPLGGIPSSHERKPWVREAESQG